MVSRGRILSHKTVDSFDGPITTWSLLVSPEMSPSARLIGYFIDSNERVVADSILLDIEDKLPTKVMEADRWEMSKYNETPSANIKCPHEFLEWKW